MKEARGQGWQPLGERDICFLELSSLYPASRRVFHGHVQTSKLEMWAYLLKDIVRAFSHQTLTGSTRSTFRGLENGPGEPFRLFHILLPWSTSLTQHFPLIPQREKEIETHSIDSFTCVPDLTALALGEQEINDWGCAMKQVIGLYITIFVLKIFCFHSWGLLDWHEGKGE